MQKNLEESKSEEDEEEIIRYTEPEPKEDPERHEWVFHPRVKEY